ncbi:MAG: hypothetical protein IJP36_06645, partial [Bacteroides sp.]|nr:hypothetical protein [Bacteroides sp.]
LRLRFVFIVTDDQPLSSLMDGFCHQRALVLGGRNALRPYIVSVYTDTARRVPTKVAMKHFILKLVFFIRIYFLCDRFYSMEGLYVISKYGNTKNVASDALFFCQPANQ